ncbi:MAG: hypothetical protein LRS47_03410 [Desulfurococcales archaeon]|nr:hypothetical protein [Desulfurococcales archaeon]
MGEEAEIVSVVCKLLRRMESRNSIEGILSGFSRLVLRLAGIPCNEKNEPSIDEAWLRRVEYVLHESSAPLRIGADLFGLDIRKVDEVNKDCDIYCRIDSIFSSLHARAGGSKARFQVMEAYGFLRSVFEYAFLLLSVSRDEGLLLFTLEVTGKEEFLASSRIPFDYGKASMLISEAVMYASYKVSLDSFFKPLGRWSIRRPLSLVNPYFEESILHGYALGGLNPAILNIILPNARDNHENPRQIVLKIESYLREYWEEIVSSEYVTSILEKMEERDSDSMLNINKEYGDWEKTVELLKKDLPFTYNATAFSVESGELKLLLQEGWEKRLNYVLKFLNKDDYKISRKNIRGGLLPLLYMESSIYHSNAARSLVYILPEEYFDILEKSHKNLVKYKGRLVCTNCYLRPYILWNQSEDPQHLSVENKSFLRIRPHERLCPVHLVLRLAKNVGERYGGAC